MALTKFTSCLAALAIFLNQGCDLLRATSAPFLFKLCFHAHKLPIPRPKLSRWGSAAAYAVTDREIAGLELVAELEQQGAFPGPSVNLAVIYDDGLKALR